MDTERYEKHSSIVTRAMEMGLSVNTFLDAMIDMEHADNEFNLRLDEFLDSHYEDFTHDFCGIQKHINRTTKKFEDGFVPRFAG